MLKEIIFYVQVDSNCILHSNLRGSSHYATQAEGSLSKLSKGEGRSPLKYIMSVLLPDFEYFIEKMIGLLAKVWISIPGVSKLLPRGQTLGTKSAKKGLPCRHFGGLSPFKFGH